MSAPVSAVSAPSTVTVTVTARRPLTARVDEFRLEPAAPGVLPGWTPGAHLDVTVPGGGAGEALVRQYSLCSDPADRSGYTIAVDRAADSRGGSTALHELATVGTPLQVGEPRNHFPLTRALNYVFVAGGIGVTPIVAYARAAVFHGWDLEVVYSHSAPEDAFAAELRELTTTAGGRFTEVGHRDELTAVLTDRLQRQPLGTRAYACGPEGMIELYRSVAASQGWPDERLHWEHFGVADLPPGSAFEYRVAGDPDGRTRRVEPGVSLLDALLGEGRPAPYLCRQGVCGQCRLEVAASAEDLDHRDHVLDDTEREAGDCILTCVSRGTGNGILEVTLP